MLFTTADAKEAARSADRVVSIEAGRLVADQEAAEFARTRLRPRVAVRTPHAARLADVLGREARAAQRAVEIVEESGSRLSVYGSNCAEVGEAAFRHGVLVHQLADETGDAGASTAPVPHARAAAATAVADGTAPEPAEGSGRPARRTRSQPPASAVRRVGGPLRPLRYELLRVFGTATPVLTTALVVVVSVLTALVLARAGQTPQSRLLAAWPELLPLPPAALGAGLLGALAFGEEYRYPALAADRGTVPRRLGLLLAKLGVCAALALLLGALVVTADAAALALVFDSGPLRVPAEWLSPAASWAGLLIGCAWAGVLASGVFRSATAGLAAVLAVPVGVVPLVRKALEGSSAYPVTGLGPRLRGLSWVQWPPEADRLLVGALRVITQPVATALVLSLMVLLCAYGFTGLRSRVRW